MDDVKEHVRILVPVAPLHANIDLLAPLSLSVCTRDWRTLSPPDCGLSAHDADGSWLHTGASDCSLGRNSTKNIVRHYMGTLCLARSSSSHGCRICTRCLIPEGNRIPSRPLLHARYCKSDAGRKKHRK